MFKVLVGDPFECAGARKLEIKMKVRTIIIFFLIDNSSNKINYKRIKNRTKGTHQTLLPLPKTPTRLFLSLMFGNCSRKTKSN